MSSLVLRGADGAFYYQNSGKNTPHVSAGDKQKTLPPVRGQDAHMTAGETPALLLRYKRAGGFGSLGLYFGIFGCLIFIIFICNLVFSFTFNFGSGLVRLDLL